MRLLKLHSTILLLYVLVIAACNSNNETATATSPHANEEVPVSKDVIFDRLIGTWQNTDGKSFESWYKNEDGSLRAAAYQLKGTDTIWTERASIYPENGKWVFENTVSGQNEGKAVKFISTQMNANSVQFTNPAHDFPTDINYTLTSDGSLHAFIIGPNKKGGKDTIPFDFRKIR